MVHLLEVKALRSQSVVYVQGTSTPSSIEEHTLLYMERRDNLSAASLRVLSCVLRVPRCAVAEAVCRRALCTEHPALWRLA